MELIPVLDVAGGRAVRAEGGDRARYQPLTSVVVRGSDPVALARSLRGRLGLETVYLAHLDAIASGGAELEPAVALVRALAREGLGLWIDAGVSDRRGLAALLEAGARRVVVGLETLPRLEVLPRLVAECGGGRLAFSLDLRGDRPVTRMSALAALTPARIALSALEAGFSTMIVLDLDRVGGRRGLPIERLAALRREGPRARGVAGGGVRGVADLESLSAAGYAACLVGTALHDGSITPEDVRRLALLAPVAEQVERPGPGARAGDGDRGNGVSRPSPGSRGRMPIARATPRPRSPAS